MKNSDIIAFSFREEQARIAASPLYSHPTASLWQRCLSVGSLFCEAVVAAGFLTWEQMVCAAGRYCLGATRRQGVIFWQIDREGRVHDGKVMYYGPDCHRLKDRQHHPTWVSTLLARRSALRNVSGQSSHCFFGLHLVDGLQTVCVVESEKSAIILSVLYPDCVWLATGGLGELQPDKFRPLRGCKVVLFPDTDSDGIAFRRWHATADVVMQQPFWEDSPPVRVSPLLERHATRQQKAAKIDLVDYWFEASKHHG